MQFRIEELKYLHQIRVIQNIKQLVERSISLIDATGDCPPINMLLSWTQIDWCQALVTSWSVNFSYKQWINIHIQVLLQGPDMAFVDLKSRPCTGEGVGRKREEGEGRRRRQLWTLQTEFYFSFMVFLHSLAFAKL